jgi:hypothetical protein
MLYACRLLLRRAATDRRSRQAFDPRLYHTRPQGWCTEMSAVRRTLKKDFYCFLRYLGTVLLLKTIMISSCENGFNIGKYSVCVQCLISLYEHGFNIYSLCAQWFMTPTLRK